MTAQEVADLLQVPKSWMYESARDGRVPHVRLGRYVRFERDQIEEWLSTIRLPGRDYAARSVAPRRSN